MFGEVDRSASKLLMICDNFISQRWIIYIITDENDNHSFAGSIRSGTRRV